ncbi:hypothetical protein C6P40_001972 [Pichia californica]|uniref:PhoD-like phosphatase domain-containing protein n=1 Tax=Pichia californica TaxID=460514 RepID=A0A9P6WID3_9ASCO|nr:hypothetical protein C6P40_001972 [[Candida] californica]
MTSNPTQLETSHKSWFTQLPMDNYLQSVVDTAPDKIKGEKEDACPSDYNLGDLSIACGPLVRFLASHENDSNNYRGSILLVVRNFDSNQKIPIVNFAVGPSIQNDISKEFFLNFFDPLKSEIIHHEKEFTFFRYFFQFELQDYEQKVKYSVSKFTLPHYQFYIPTKYQSMNIMSFSCNGFSLGTDTESFKGSLWLDVIRKHNNPNFHYHVMIGGGDQIYADSIKNISKKFQEWLKHKHIHSKEKLTQDMEDSFDDYYLNRYISWFGKGYWYGTVGKTIQSILPIALATIPQINIFDDHDIIDGFGSYSDITMRQEIFAGVGQHAFKYYMLFQHHTPYNESPQNESSWIMGKTKGPYITENSRSIFAKLGKSIAFLGLDCRTERTKHQIVTSSTYDLTFDRLEKEIHNSIQAGKQIKHLLVLLGVPICYPRMVFLERIMDSPLISPILYLARKGIIAHGLVNEFDGEVELLDDLNDHWCSHSHKLERNKLMDRLQKFGERHNVRITILSGDVHLCCASRFRTLKSADELNPKNDPNFILNLISSAIVNAPPPDGMVKFLSMRARKHIFHFRIAEDMVPLFDYEAGSNNHRDHPLFMNKRNYSDIIPVENLSKEYILKHFGETTNKYFIPGKVVVNKEASYNDAAENMSAFKSKNSAIGYPLEEDGIIATIHVENSTENPKSETSDYEIVVPPLEAKELTSHC